MSTTFDTAPTLTAKQLQKMLALARKADSVELKATVPEEHGYTTAIALGIDPLDAHVRQAYFFDTPDLTLHHTGVVVCARRIQHEAPDSVVKLRPVVLHDLPDRLRASKRFGVEVDAMPGSYVCSGSLKGAPDEDALKDALAGRRPLRKVFSKHQRAFFAEHAPAGIELDDLAVLGPINLVKLKFRPQGLSCRLTVEVWNYPDGSRVIELSTKCKPAKALDTAAAVRDFLADRGVGLSAVQQTKTRTALEHFSERLSTAAG